MVTLRTFTRDAHPQSGINSHRDEKKIENNNIRKEDRDAQKARAFLKVYLRCSY